MNESEGQFTIEQQVQAIDHAALTAVIRQVMQSNTVEVVEWHYQPIVEGSTGGSVFRLRGTGRDQARIRAWSVILKFVPAPDDPTELIQASHDQTEHTYWRREWLLYESGFFGDLPDGLTVPRCFQAEELPNGYWLWLEDIEDMFGRQWPVSHYSVAGQHLGRFNGQYLAGREMPALPYLVSHQQRLRAIEKSILESDILSHLSALREQHAILQAGWPAGVLEEFHRIWLDREQFFQALNTLPETLKHGDSGHRNLFARPSGDGTIETVAIDWEFAGVGRIGEDLASLVVSTVIWFGLSPTQLTELDQIVFEGYLEGLRDVGWRGDPQAVRLGYTAYTSLNFGFSSTRLPELLALDEPGRLQVEAWMGHPIEEIADNMAAVRHFICACANEARALMA